jgi:hypothetical protein
LEIILNIALAAVIFGALATGPILTWLAVAWLVTDRRRPASGSPST